MTRRRDRVAEAIRRLACEIFRGELRDPRVTELITVTKVEVTPDLRLAKIYYSILGDENKKKLVGRGLKSARRYIRKRIADELKLRYAPEVLLRFDEACERKERIDTILNKLHKEAKDEGDRKDSKGDPKV